MARCANRHDGRPVARNRLRIDFLRAIRELSAFESQQTQAVIDGDPEAHHCEEGLAAGRHE